MLTVESLRIDLGDFTLRADFCLPSGSKCAIIGPSGAGKSTLLAAIAGFVTPVEGKIACAGADLGPLEPGERPATIVFQEQNLFPHLSVVQNVALGISPSLRLSASDQERVHGTLQRVGLDGLEGRKPAALSGGQQSRVALARALLRGRPLLLLDEPFAALGPALRLEMLDLVDEVVQETSATLLMVTHDPRDAERIAEQTILVADGTAHPPVATKALLAEPPAALRDYL